MEKYIGFLASTTAGFDAGDGEGEEILNGWKAKGVTNSGNLMQIKIINIIKYLGVTMLGR